MYVNTKYNNGRMLYENIIEKSDGFDLPASSGICGCDINGKFELTE